MEIGIGSAITNKRNNAAAPRNYTTLDPAKKGTVFTLSNGNLTATQSGGQGGVMSIIGKSSGKWYWEYTCSNATGINFFGIALGTYDVNTFLGANANGWAYRSDTGNKYTNVNPVAYGAAWVAGDVIGIALDMDAGTITYYKNGVSQGVAFTGLTGTIYAAVGTNGGGIAGTFNFGASALTYTPPAGYNAGLYS